MRNKQAGFTLIELMIVVVIIGVFTAALANMATQFYLEKRANTMDERLDEIRSALGRFIADDPSIPPPGTVGANDPVRYPCPASMTLVPGDTDFAMEQCPPAGTPVGQTVNGVKVVQGNGGLVLVGAVPTSTLSISSKNMLDPYNNRFTYAVSWDLADENENEALNNPLNTAAVDVQDEGNNPLPNSPAPFVVVSHGRDGAGSYTAQGVANGNGCATASTDGDARNCAWQTDSVGTFRMQQAFTMGTGAFYDDQIEFTLSNGDDDQWWSVMPGTGQNITNNNLDDVVVGTITGDPQGKLHVHGDAGDAGRLAITGPGDGLIQSSLYLSDDQDSVFDNGWAMAQEQAGDDLWIARLISDGTPPTTRTDIAIDSVTGNVGIGTENPRGVLDIPEHLTIYEDTGAAVRNDLVTISTSGLISNVGTGIEIYGNNGMAGNGGSFSRAIFYDADRHVFRQETGAVPPLETQMIIDDGGNVGIGTDDPQMKLHVAGAGGESTLMLQTTSDAPNTAPIAIQMGNNLSTIDYAMYTDYDDNFRIHRVTGIPGNAFDFVINQDGNVGIGTTDPAEELHIREGNGSTDAEIYLEYSGAAGGTARTFSVSSSSDGLIIRDRTASSIRFAIEPDGDIIVNGSQAHASDGRLKKGIDPIGQDWEKLLQLNPVSYYWKDDGRPKEKQIGLVAQDVEKVYPELVSEHGEEGTKSLNYTALIAPMIEAIKEQQKQIETQNAHIKKLESEMATLKKEITP